MSEEEGRRLLLDEARQWSAKSFEELHSVGEDYRKSFDMATESGDYVLEVSFLEFANDYVHVCLVMSGTGISEYVPLTSDFIVYAGGTVDVDLADWKSSTNPPYPTSHGGFTVVLFIASMIVFLVFSLSSRALTGLAIGALMYALGNCISMLVHGLLTTRCRRYAHYRRYFAILTIIAAASAGYLLTR